MANKKLLKKIIAQSQSDNQSIKEQLNQQQKILADARSELENYSVKSDDKRNDLIEKIDSQFSQILNINKTLSEQISGLQKDTAVIMEILQLILTNMLLDEVPENDFNDEGK